RAGSQLGYRYRYDRFSRHEARQVCAALCFIAQTGDEPASQRRLGLPGRDDPEIATMADERLGDGDLVPAAKAGTPELGRQQQSEQPRLPQLQPEVAWEVALPVQVGSGPDMGRGEPARAFDDVRHASLCVWKRVRLASCARTARITRSNRHGGTAVAADLPLSRYTVL